MIVSMMDDNTYVVGEKIYKVGDEIDLMPIPGANFRGQLIPVEHLNTDLVAAAARIRECRAMICRSLHEHDAHYSDNMAGLAMEYENAQRDWLFSMDLLFKAIQAHLGAPVPLHRDTKTGKISIRKRDQHEAMNYTRDAVANLVRFNAYAPLRDLLLKVLKVEDVEIMSDLHLDTEMPCMSTKFGMSTTCAGVVQFLSGMVKNGISHLNFGLPIALMWVLKDGTKYFFDARGAVPKGQPQGNELMALNMGVQRATKSLLAPEMIGVLMPTKIDKETMGIIASVISAKESRHEIYKFVSTEAEPEGLHLEDAGDGTKLHPNIENILKSALAKE